MSNTSENPQHHLETEQKVIHLMLKARQVVSELLENGYSSAFFDDAHRHLVDAIFEEYIASDYKRLLTRDSYRQLIQQSTRKSDLMHLLRVYDKCFIKVFARADDLSYLKKQLVEGYISRHVRDHFEQFRKDSGKSYQYAVRNLVDNLQSAMLLTESHQTSFESLAEFRDEYVGRLRRLKENPHEIVRCGIPEIDNAIQVGFRPQHLTLFVGDVGGHKTNVMLNVALNIYDRGYNVLLVPLEMPRDDITNRIVANRVGINAEKLARPEMLSDAELDKIRDAKMWVEKDSRFCILDADERTSVSALRHEIDKHIVVFKPHVVVIDYADLLQINVGRNSIRSFEIGEMLKNLRFMGKKYNFHIITAAQMNRAAIKSLREGKDEALDSTAVHGSHSYSADSDTIFGLMKVPGETDKIKIYTIKARHGPSAQLGELRVDPMHCLVSSTDDMLSLTSEVELDDDLNRTPDEISTSLGDQRPDLDFASDPDLTTSDEFAGLGL